MAVTDWVAVGVGVVPSTLGSVSGVVVNGSGTGSAPAPTSGRGYPE